MNFRRFINSGLIVGLLLNTSFISNASTLSEDGRYETFAGDNIHISDILKEDSVDAKIEGNTLVNVIGSTVKIVNPDTTTEKNGVISIVQDTIQSEQSIINFNESIVDTDKTYTLVFDIIENTLSNSNYESVAKFNIVNYNNGTHHIRQGDEGLQKIVLKQSSVTTHNGKPYLEVYRDSLGKLKIGNVMLLEGDFTNVDISYFKGMKSVAELEHNKLGITVRNKNLAQDVEYLEGVEYLNSCRMKGDLKPNTTYAVTITIPEGQKFVSEYQFTFTRRIALTGDGTPKTVILTTKDKITKRGGYTEIFFNEAYHSSDGTASDLQIEYGEESTDYKNHQSYIKETALKEPLRSISDKIKDRIVKKNGQWFIERNCGQRVFNGTEGWQVHGNLTNEKVAFFVLANKHDNNVKLDARNPIIVNDRFKSVSRVYFDTNTNKEAISLHSNNGVDSWYSLGILKSRLSDTSVSSFKEWLRNNPIEVVYPLDEPRYEPINVDFNFSLYKDVTNIEGNSTVPMNIEMTIDRVVNKAFEAVELAKTSPTILNISKARMWSNLIEEDSIKDELQGHLNSIANIEDLQFERKTSSSNMDLYIKSENMLSISLNTSNITFENFDGVKDIEELGGINVSINSSLPYSLNAYLATELQNGDKTKTMDKQILNIKESSEANYKTFNNIIEKMVLKDNNMPGNNISHGIDFKLKGGLAFEKDIYKATLRFEAEQK